MYRLSFSVGCTCVTAILLSMPCDAALIGHWQFDDPGNIGLDSAGGDNNGTDIDDLDTSFSATARVGAGALSITGLGTGLELANSETFQPLTTFTVAAFVNADRDDPAFGFVGRVFSSLRTPTGDLTNGNNGWGFGVLRSGRLRYTTYGIQDYDTNAGTLVPTDSWAHVAVVVTEGSAEFFVNGASAQTIAGGNPAANADPFYIGAGSVFSTDPFAGLIDDVRVYDEALTDAAVAALAAAPQTGFHAQINRATGALTLNNSSTLARVISAVDVTSAAGSLDSAGWLSIAANYDSNSGGTVDPNDVWTETSRTASEMAEMTPGSATIAPAQVVNYGAAWLKSPFEDVNVDVLLSDGTMLDLPVVYVGNSNAPFAIADLNFDGAINNVDWPIYRSGYGQDLSAMSAAQAYRSGDLNSDGVNNVDDFGIFKTAFDSANGAGAFEAMVAAVPEPVTWMLLAVGGVLLTGRRARRVACPLVTALVAVALLASPSEATLLGHWKFEDSGNLGLDSAGGDNNGAGGADATFSINSAAGIGALKLTGLGTGLQLANSETFQPLTTFTIAAFVNADLDNPAFGFVGRPFSSLSTPVGGSNDGYGFGVLKSGGLRHTTYGIQDYDQPASVPTDTWTHVAVVVTEGNAEFFVAGTSVGTIAGGNPTPTAHPFHIGAGAVSATDPFVGLIDELRVYDEALDAATIAELAAGFDPLRLTLQVNTTTGATRIVNNTGATFSIDHYEIASVGDSLNAGGWGSLQDNPIAGFPAGNGTGNGWEKLGTPDSDLLAEAFLQGSSSFSNGLSINLGAAYNTAMNVQDLTFTYRLPTGDVLDGTVSYISGGVNGDYNANGVVDAADYVLWRNGGPLQNDQTAGIQPQDYDVWRANFGRTSGGGAASGSGVATGTVPEPATIIVLMVGVVAPISLSRSRPDFKPIVA
jgi:hypothetical protein